MTKIPIKDFVRGLTDKGFEYSSGGRQPHEKLRLCVNGKKTGISVPLSRGSRFKEFGHDLVGIIKKELWLDTNKQVADLVDCPLKKEQYIEILISKGLKF